MKKVLTNAEVVKHYRVLKSFKSRPDIIPGDVNIFWSTSVNLNNLLKHIEMLDTVIKDIVNANFTDENSHVETINGKESKVFNDDVKTEMTRKLERELAAIDSKTVELDFEGIPEESLKEMFKKNESTLSMAEMETMSLFIDK